MNVDSVNLLIVEITFVFSSPREFVMILVVIDGDVTAKPRYKDISRLYLSFVIYLKLTNLATMIVESSRTPFLIDSVKVISPIVFGFMLSILFNRAASVSP